MTKFADQADPGYTAVVGELRRWTKALREASNRSIATGKNKH